MNSNRDEHQNRAPNCPFFKLYEEFGPPKKKTARSKASKVSRLSVQSVAPSETTLADLTTMTTTTIGMDDTALTTASTATTGTKKGRARKGTTSKPKKTKAKKDEVTELEDVLPSEPEVLPLPTESTPEVQVQPESEPEPQVEDEPAPAPKPKAKAKRGKKKASEAVEELRPEEPTVPVSPKEPTPVPAAEPEPEPEAEAEPIPAPKSKAKPKRGKKRGSEAVEESTITAPEVPVAKRRDTRSREDTVDTFMTANEDTQMTVEAPVTKPARGRKPSGTRKASAAKTAAANRKASAASRISSLSIASTMVPMEEFPDDDEIERQLQADLDQLSDDDVRVVSDSDRRRSNGRKSTDRKSLEFADPQPAHNSNYAMFDPVPKKVDEAVVEEELEMLQAQMDVDEPQEEQIIVPKKGRKASVRKASKQVKAQKTKAPSLSPAEEEPEPEPLPEPQVEEAFDDEEASLGSTDTVVKKTQPEFDSEPEEPKRKRGRSSKVSFSSQEPEEAPVPAEVKQPVKRGRGRPAKGSIDAQEQTEPTTAQPEQKEQPIKRSRGRPPKASIASQASVDHETSKMANTSRGTDISTKAADAPLKRGRGRPPKVSVDAQKLQEWKAPKMPGAFREDTVEPTEDVQHDAEDDMIDEMDDGASDELAQDFPMPPTTKPLPCQIKAPTPATPGQISSPATARQAILSPSQSPQASDAENQPPSSVPASSTVKRIPLAPVTATPVQTSPSKRNVVAGLQSSTPWSAIKLDKVMASPSGLTDKENDVNAFLRKGKELTSPEKEMTVEEWIQFNASQAEKALRLECEAMVSKFENEGTRAMRVLEGLEVTE